MRFMLTRRNENFRPGLIPFQDDINRLFDEFFNIKYVGLRDPEWLPAMDLYEDEENIYIKIDAAGFENKDLDVSIDENILTISGKKIEEKEENDGKNYILSERRSGSFSRSITLPAGIDQKDIKCEFKNGVLATTVKKANPEKKEKIQITVN
ncbi:MAG: Hsp20/alpha crystallin family protein [Leptospirales bacterium]|nr:Hsp20/alpha crystallin family protein [Leptospirales bacterium]